MTELSVDRPLEIPLVRIDEREDIKVFVQLAYGFGGRNWSERYDRGEIIGVNERFAYGYLHASAMGCDVVYSEDYRETRFGRILRLAIRVLLGFDLVHAWRNRQALYRADVVWTHTESQSLAVTALLAILRKRPRPKLILQSVWLIDRWRKTGAARRWLWRHLMSSGDILTFHSSANWSIAQRIFADNRCEIVLFGIRASEVKPVRDRPLLRPIKLIAVGNDVHRDWKTLIDAVAELPNVELTIVSQRAQTSLVSGLENVTLVSPSTNAALTAIYDRSDIAILPLKPNLHASGVTALQEAVLYGLPVICSDVGGLRDYFSEDEVAYVPAASPEALRQQIAALVNDDVGRAAMARRAQAKMGPNALSSQSFVRRHVELSRELLGW